MQTQEKRKRGRPLNSTTLTTIALSELIAKFGPDTKIPVGRLWLNGSSAVKETSVTTPATSSSLKEPENKVEMTLTVD